jgi:UDP-N-acetylmuramate--alanine ligase
MKVEDIKSVYFIGAGGIGMSALVRYFLLKKIAVAGYDRKATPLTDAMLKEGADLHFEDNPDLIPEAFRDKETTLVVYTPAIPKDHKELNYFRERDFEIKKRAQVLGILTQSMKGLCVAGTHGKTTTTTMIAHLLMQTPKKCNAFMGGISKNYGTNYLFSDESDYVVVEADEFDRSFHWLSPYISVVTATDPDHLDIYGTYDAYLESFRDYSHLIQPGGTLIVHTGLAFRPNLQAGVKQLSYSLTTGDFHADNIRMGGGEITFDFISIFGNIEGIRLGVPVEVNIENGIAAMAVAQLCGATDDMIRKGMETFKGVDRRFDIRIKSDKLVLLSDYAHHPEEIKRCAESLRGVFNGRKITAIFQPHLYTRTRDLYKDFARSLSVFDEVILTEIYPAREEPIPGVTSEIIYDNMRPDMEKQIIDSADILTFVEKHDFDVLVILGAGNLDDKVPQIAEILKHRM